MPPSHSGADNESRKFNLWTSPLKYATEERPWTRQSIRRHPEEWLLILHSQVYQHPVIHVILVNKLKHFSYKSQARSVSSTVNSENFARILFSRIALKVSKGAKIRNRYIHIITLVTWSDGSDHVEWVRQERPDHTRRSRVWSGRSWRTHETWSDPSDQVTKVIMYLLYTYKINNKIKARTT